MNATSSQDEFAKWAKLRRQYDKASADYEGKGKLLKSLSLPRGFSMVGIFTSAFRFVRVILYLAIKMGSMLNHTTSIHFTINPSKF